MKRLVRILLLFVFFATLIHYCHVARAAESGLLVAPGVAAITTLNADGTVTPAPLSAIAVSQCGLAVALFVQLDATHLLRADPRQSDMFVAVDGKMQQTKAGPMEWKDAFKIAESAVITTHVTLPCTEGSAI